MAEKTRNINISLHRVIVEKFLKDCAFLVYFQINGSGMSASTKYFFERNLH